MERRARKKKAPAAPTKASLKTPPLRDSEAQQTICPSQTKNAAGTSFIQEPRGIGERQLSISRKCPLLIKSNIISQLPVIISLLLLQDCAAFLI